MSSRETLTEDGITMHKNLALYIAQVYFLRDDHFCAEAHPYLAAFKEGFNFKFSDTLCVSQVSTIQLSLANDIT